MDRLSTKADISRLNNSQPWKSALILISIVQGATLALLAIVALTVAASTVNQRLAYASSMLVILLVWLEFTAGSVAFRWTPNRLETLLPCGLGLLQSALILGGQSSPRAFLILHFFVWAAITLTFANFWFHARRSEGIAQRTYQALGPLIRSGSIISGYSLGASLLLFLTYELIGGRQATAFLTLSLLVVLPLSLHSIAHVIAVPGKIRATEHGWMGHQQPVQVTLAVVPVAAPPPDPALLRQAMELFKNNNFHAAEDIYAGILQSDPDNLDIRGALALCQQKLDRHQEATKNYSYILERDPSRYQNAYSLGCILQFEGAYQHAIHAFDQVLAVEPTYRETASRRRACQDMLQQPTTPTQSFRTMAGAPHRPATAVVTGDVLPRESGGLLSLKALADTHGIASLGNLIMVRKQKFRYHLPSLARTVLEATAVSLIPAAYRFLHSRLPQVSKDAIAGMPTQVSTVVRWVVVLAIVVFWVRVVARAVPMIIVAWLGGVIIHERGMEVGTGILHRNVKTIWYYQITDEPEYQRVPIMFLTHTASLVFKYNDTPTTTQDVKLDGIGSPREVHELREYLRERRVAERTRMRGSLT